MVGTNNWKADGLPAGSIGPETEHTFSDGTVVKYREAAVPSPGGYMLFYRIPAGIDPNVALKSLQKSEILDTIIDGPAGLTKIQDHVTDAVDAVSGELQKWRKMVSSYKKAEAGGDIIDNDQLNTIHEILDVVEPGIPTREDELKRLSKLKTAIDLRLAITTGNPV